MREALTCLCASEMLGLDCLNTLTTGDVDVAAISSAFCQQAASRLQPEVLEARPHPSIIITPSTSLCGPVSMIQLPADSAPLVQGLQKLDRVVPGEIPGRLNPRHRELFAIKSLRHRHKSHWSHCLAGDNSGQKVTDKKSSDTSRKQSAPCLQHDHTHLLPRSEPSNRLECSSSGLCASMRACVRACVCVFAHTRAPALAAYPTLRTPDCKLDATGMAQPAQLRRTVRLQPVQD